jgi:hypothetical protein
MSKVRRRSREASVGRRMRDIGPHMRAIIDLRKREPVPQGVSVNEATAYITRSILGLTPEAAALPRNVRFIALAGVYEPAGLYKEFIYCSEVEGKVEDNLAAWLEKPGHNFEMTCNHDFMFKLFVTDKYAKARNWLGTCDPYEERWLKQFVSARIAEVTASVRKSVEKIVDDLPSNYVDRRAALVAMSDTFREEMARAIAPALNENVQSLEQNSYEAKKTTAKYVNAELRRIGLAIRCPRTSEPTLLQAYPGNHPDEGRYRLDYTDAEGRRHHTVSWNTLPQLELMPDNLTRVPYGQHSHRSR